VRLAGRRLFYRDEETAYPAVDVEPRAGLPIKDAADGVAAVNAVPEAGNVLRIPDESPLKSGNEEPARGEVPDELRDVLILDGYFLAAIAQGYFECCKVNSDILLFAVSSRPMRNEFASANQTFLSLVPVMPDRPEFLVGTLYSETD
jgi:hypothetical protein